MVILLNNEIDRPHLFGYLSSKKPRACTTLWGVEVILRDQTIEFSWMGSSVSEDRCIQDDWYLDLCRGGTRVNSTVCKCFRSVQRWWSRNEIVCGQSWKTPTCQRWTKACDTQCVWKKETSECTVECTEDTTSLRIKIAWQQTLHSHSHSQFFPTNVSS